MKPRPITVSEAKCEAARLEHTYGRGFLEKSLHEVGVRWRELTASNAEERISLGQILTTRDRVGGSTNP